ncbi:transcription repressor OFP15 [Syzygium oleosum]|uniref:transcription repressor OFP15 n=1 Tax=Syzygium oleosum TaxID=219896 RepID=UPI0011D2B726|nr:transcription repressor OFP15 [Syzygium oleosum]
MKLLSLYSKNHHHHNVPDTTASTWPWPYCHQPRTLSFRDADPVPIFKTINSAFVLDPAADASDASDASDPSFPIAAAAAASSSSEESPSFSTAHSELPDDRADGGGGGDDDAAVECVIRGARSERRLFFEPSRGDTSSILADPRSLSNAEPNEDVCEANEEEEEENDGDVAAFKKEDVTLLAMESRDPYEDFRKSMEEMVEAHGVKGDDWECLEQLLCCYLRVNDRDNHGYIYGAFVDLLVDGDRLRRRSHQCRIPGHQSPSSPLSLYNTSSSSLSSSSSSSLSARRVSISEAEETVSETTPCSSSSGVSLEAVEDEGGRLRR